MTVHEHARHSISPAISVGMSSGRERCALAGYAGGTQRQPPPGVRATSTRRQGTQEHPACRFGSPVTSVNEVLHGAIPTDATDRCGKIPIAPHRGFVQSGFNEVRSVKAARSAVGPHRTLQIQVSLRRCASASASLPKRPERLSRRECRPFFGGLLPEESQRLVAAQVLGVSPANDFALLDRLGGDVAGAL
jgi:hypothetical protein